MQSESYACRRGKPSDKPTHRFSSCKVTQPLPNLHQGRLLKGSSGLNPDDQRAQLSARIWAACRSAAVTIVALALTWDPRRWQYILLPNGRARRESCRIVRPTYASNPSFRVGIQIRASCRQSHDFHPRPLEHWTRTSGRRVICGRSSSCTLCGQ